MNRSIKLSPHLNQVWGKTFTEADLLLIRGFVLSPDNVLDKTIHTESDQDYFNSYREERTDKKTKQKICFLNYSRMVVEVIDTEKSWSYGMSGPFDYPVKNNKATVPLEFLDPGIALLVKVLPSIGIHTLYSCSGHLKGNPVFYFKSQDDINWMGHVLNSLLTNNVVKKKFIFKSDFGWMGNRIEFSTTPGDLESHYEAYHLGIQIGKELLNPKTRMILNYFKV